MRTENLVLVAGFAVNLAALILLLLQTRHLATQTKALSKSLEYTSYQKLVDYTNDVSRLLLENQGWRMSLRRWILLKTAWGEGCRWRKSASRG